MTDWKNELAKQEACHRRLPDLEARLRELSVTSARLRAKASQLIEHSVRLQRKSDKLSAKVKQVLDAELDQLGIHPSER